MTQSGPPDPTGGGGGELPGFDASVPNPARMWNYWVGGKDNFAADRQAAEKVLEVMPSLPLIARLARRFLIDAVHRLAPGTASGSSWTSGPACRRPTTPMTSPSGWPRSPGSCTSTTTRWCSRTRGRC